MRLLFLINMCVGFVAATADEVPWQKRFDDAQEQFFAGYYRHAHDQFRALAGTDSAAKTLKALLLAAECQLMLGEYDAALRTLYEIFPQPTPDAEANSASWHNLVARAHAAMGRYEEAVKHGQQAVALDPQHAHSRYELGRLYELLGKDDQAAATYKPFDDLMHDQLPAAAEDLHFAGLGFYRYSVLTRSDNLTSRTQHVLREVLQPACMQIDLSYWPARLAIADLLREKYNLPEAFEDYQAVLKINPHATDAHLGLAKIALENWDFENVERQVSYALDINPHCAEAYVILALLRMIERRHEQALTIVQQALKINSRHIEALAVLAAAQLRLGDDEGSKKTQEQVYTINPKPAIMHYVIGKQYSDARQFPESEVELLKSIEYNSTNPDPRNELGMMYMQWGRESKAREVLDAAYALDAFNARTVNTLRLLENLEGFNKYIGKNFDIHYDAAKDAVLGEYFSEYLEGIYTELCEDYEITLPEKTTIEVFPDHRAFGVRIHGKPWIHTIGACTGTVIAMDAPRREVHHPYNWADVLRHEFTHTVTLAATNNRIPHWFTEGLAVLQEDRPKSWEWQQLLSDALRREEMFTLASVDWGFIRPRKPSDRQLAYAQSEWMCEFLIERFGYEVINKMLKLYRDGQVQPEVIPAVAQWSPDEFDRQFRVWARQQAESWGFPLDRPTDLSAVKLLQKFYPASAALHARLAEVYVEQGELETALEQVRAALEIDPHHRQGLKQSAKIHYLLVPYQASPDQKEKCLIMAKQQMELLAKHDPDEPSAAEFLAQWSQQNQDDEGAIFWATKLKQLQPNNPVSSQILSTTYLKRNEDDLALPELLEYARHDEHDADIPRQIARIYSEKDQKQAALDWYRQSLNIDPYDVPTHLHYARLVGELKDAAETIKAYQALTILAPQDARHFSELAFAYFRAGRLDEAKRTAQQAVALDPASPAKQLLSNP